MTIFPRYVSSRFKNLKVGISSYSEDRTALEVIGNVGVGTTNPDVAVGTGNTAKLAVGVATANNIYAKQYFGDENNNFNALGAGSGQIGINSGANRNILIGRETGKLLTTGYRNIMMGLMSGCDMTTGNSNIALGYNSLRHTTSGSSNIAFGTKAGRYNLTGHQNIYFGSSAGSSNTGGNQNIAIGAYADWAGNGHVGICNVLLGARAGQYNFFQGNKDSYVGNIALGGCAGSTAFTNTFSTYASTSCFACNTLLGFSAGKCIGADTGHIDIVENIYIGPYSACRNYGGCNVLIGSHANVRGFPTGVGETASVGNLNIGIGHSVCLAKQIGSRQLAIGHSDFQWIHGDSDYNVGIGITDPSRAVTSSDTQKLAVGILTAHRVFAQILSFTSGVGPNTSGQATTSGANIAIGDTFTGNTFSNSDGNYGNISIGDCAGLCIYNGFKNVFIGDCAGSRVSTGDKNVAIGACAMGGGSGGTITGSENFVFGQYAGIGLTSGSKNILMGDNSSGALTSGTDNIALGTRVGGATITGCRNIMLGSRAGGIFLPATTGYLNDNIIIGSCARAPVDGASNYLVLGNAEHQYASFDETTNWIVGDPNYNIGIGIGTPTSKLHVKGNILITGVSTFTGAIDANGDLDVDGNTTLDNLVVAESANISGGLTADQLNITGVTTFGGNVSIAGTLTYEDVTNVDSIGIVTAGHGLRVTKGGINVTAGISTFSDDTIIDGSLTVGNASGVTGGAPTDQGNLAVYGHGKNSLIIQTTQNILDRGIAWRNSGDAYVAYIAAVDRGSSQADLRFGVDLNNNSVDSVSERMRITKEGSLGIGLTNPAAKLDVLGQTKTTDLNVTGVSTFADDIFVGTGATVGFGSTAYFNHNVEVASDRSFRIGGKYSTVYNSNTNSVFATNTASQYITSSDSITLQSLAGGKYFKAGPYQTGIYHGKIGAGARRIETNGVGVTVYNQLDTTFLNVSGVVTATRYLGDAQENFYAGTNAGSNSDSDTCKNVAIGFSAGSYLNSGDHNVFLGSCAGTLSQSSMCNVSIGHRAGFAIGMGTANVSIGDYAGQGNVANAVGAGNQNNTVAYNVSLGAFAQFEGVTAHNNVSLGCAAHVCNRFGSYNIAIGHSAGACSTSTCHNILMGTQAGLGLTTGYNNVAIGRYAGSSQPGETPNVGGSFAGGDTFDNVSIGHSAGSCMTSSGNYIANRNVYIGRCAGIAATTSCYNTVVGADAGIGMTGRLAYSNVLLGFCAGRCIQGARNIAIGQIALDRVANHSYGNIGIGYKAGRSFGNKTTSTNLSIGHLAGDAYYTGCRNTILGHYAGRNIENYYDDDLMNDNTIIGSCAAMSMQGQHETFENVILGYKSALYARGLGVSTAFSRNVILGSCAGAYMKGSCNIFIGPDAARSPSNFSWWTCGDSNIGIGKSVQMPDRFGSNQLAIGQTSQYWITGDQSFNVGIGTTIPTNAVNSGNTQKLAVGILTAHHVFANQYRGDESNNFYAGVNAGSGAAGISSGATLNIGIGESTGAKITSGSCNVILGTRSGCEITTGYYNTILGYNGLRQLTSGYSNVAIGVKPGRNQVSGTANIYMGTNAGLGKTDGQCNIEIGANAGWAVSGQAASSGCHNIFFGTAAGMNMYFPGGDVSSFTSNIYIGKSVGFTQIFDNTSEVRRNIFMGECTGHTFGGCWVPGYNRPVDNVIIGSVAARFNSGAHNVFLGSYVNNRTGVGFTYSAACYSIGIGHSVCLAKHQGDRQLAIGHSDYQWIIGDCDYNVGIGTTIPTNAVTSGNTQKLAVGIATAHHVFADRYHGDVNNNFYAGPFVGSGAAGITSGATLNIGIGQSTLTSISSGYRNIALGCCSGAQVTTAYDNILIGTLSGCSLTTGIRNVALGMSNLRHVTDGDYNTAIGDGAGRLDSTAAGTDARSSSYNTAVGAQAGQLKFTGCYNVSLGYRAGFLTKVTNYTTTNNNSNVFVGNSAGRGYTDASVIRGNIFLGDYAGSSRGGFGSGPAEENVNIGYRSGLYSLGSCNIYIGSHSATNVCNSSLCHHGSNNIGIGNSIQMADRFGSNQLAIGQTSQYWITGDQSFNVGIGSTIPQTKLDVGGALNVSGLSTFGGNAQFRDVVRIGKPHSEEPNVPGQFVIHDGNSFIPVKMVFSGGTLYIDPFLQVRFGQNNNYLRFYSTCSTLDGGRAGRGNIQFGYLNGEYGEKGLDIFGHGSLIMKVANKQAVGIGSTLADVTLSYDGDPKLTTNGIGVTIFNQLDATDLNISGVGTFANQLFVGGLEVTGGATIGTDITTRHLKVIGISTFEGNINANGNIVGDDSTNISGINSVTATEYYGTGAIGSKLFREDAQCNLIAGRCAGIAITTGDTTLAVNNVLLGRQVGRRLCSGDNNFIAGNSAFNFIHRGRCNIAIGLQVGTSFTQGASVNNNIFLGRYVAQSQTANTSNAIIIGNAAGKCGTANSSVIIGSSAGQGVLGQTHTSNIFLGQSAGLSVSVGSNNIIMGNGAGKCICSASSNIYFGTSAGKCNFRGCGNIGLGANSLCAANAGNMIAGRPMCNVALGVNAGSALSSGNHNFLGGTQAGCSLISGEYNIAIGSNALMCATTPSHNIALGLNAARCTTSGESNFAIGFCALFKNTSGGCNTSVGKFSLLNLTTGGCNIVMGYAAGCSMTNGCRNIFLGDQAACSFVSGSCNIAIGCRICVPLDTGSTQLAIGNRCCYYLTGDSSYNVGIGSTIPQARLDVFGGANIDEINTTGISTFNEARFANDKKLKFGDDIDLQIYHFSATNNNFISASNNADLTLSAREVELMNQGHSSYYFKGAETGSIVYHNNVERVATNGIGATVYGQLDTTDLNVTGVSTHVGITTFQSRVFIGAATTIDARLNVGNDIQIFSSGEVARFRIPESSPHAFVTYLDQPVLQIGRSATEYATFNSSFIRFKSNNVERLKVVSDGIEVSGVTDTLGLNVTTGVSTFAGIATVTGETLFTTQFNVSGVSTFNDHVFVADDKFLSVGDMQLSYLSAANSAFIVAPSGNQLILQSPGITLQDSNGNKYFKAASTNTRLFHNGPERLRTTDNGIQVTNGMVPGTSDGIPGTLSALAVDSTLLNVTGVSTFAGLVNIDAGGQANTFKVEDLTDNRIVIAGSGGELEDSANLTFDGSTLNVTGDATFSGNVSIAGTLTKEDVTNIDSVGLVTAGKGVRITSGGLNVASGISTFVGISTFKNKVFIGGGSTISDAQLYLGQDLRIRTSGQIVAFEVPPSSPSTIMTFISTPALLVGNASGSYASFGSSGASILANNVNKFQVLNEGILVSGGATITGNIDAEGTLDVDGQTELDDLNVSGITTLSGNTEFKGSLTSFVGSGTGAGNGGAPFALWSKANNYLWFSDATRILMGFGQDLEIKHSGDESIIRDTRAGVGATLAIGADRLILRNKDGNEPYLEANDNGSVKIYHDFFPKLETTGLGVTVYGTTQTQQLNVSGVTTFVSKNVHLGDSSSGNTGRLNFGSGNQLQIFYDSNTQDAKITKTGGNGNLDIQTTSGSIDIITGTTNNAAIFKTGSVELYQNNSLKFFTRGAGAAVVGILTANGLAVTSGVSTFSALVDANNRLDVVGGANIDQLNVAGVSTFLHNVGVSGTVTADRLRIPSSIPGQQRRLFIGDGSTAPMQIYYDSNNSNSNILIQNSTGGLNIRGEAIRIRDIYNTVTSAVFNPASDVQLRYSNSVKFATTNTGINVTGLTDTDSLLVSGISTFKDDVEFHGFSGVTSVRFDSSANSLKFVPQAKLKFGSNFEIYDDDDVARIHSTGSRLQFRATDFRIAGSNGLKTSLRADVGDSVRLYFDNNVKFRTASTGAVVTGILTATSFSGDGSALTGIGTQTNLGSFDNLVVAGVTTFKNDVEFHGVLGVSSITFDKSDNSLKFKDNARLRFGDDNRFQIYYKDNVNYIMAETAVDDIKIGTHGGDIILETVVGSQKGAEFKFGSSADLYYKNIKRFATSGVGVTIYNQLDTTDLNVSGVSTFSNAVKLEGGLGNLTVEGNTGLTIKNANPSLIFTDTDHNPDFSIRGGGSQFRVRSDTQAKDRLIIAADGQVQILETLDVRRHTDLDNVLIAGVATFTGNIDANGTLDVDGDTQLDDLNVAGVATFSSGIDANGTLSVHGHTALRDVATTGFVTFFPTGGTKFFTTIEAQNGMFVHNSGVSTYKTPVQIDAGATLNQLNVSGVSTFGGNLGVNADLTANSLTLNDNGSGNNTLSIATDDENVYGLTLVNDTYKVSAPAGFKISQYNSGEVEMLLRGNASTTEGLPFALRQISSGSLQWDTLTVSTAGAVGIAYSGNKKIETRSDGVAVVGILTANGLAVTSGVSTFAGNIVANGNIVGDSATTISGIAGITAKPTAVDTDIFSIIRSDHASTKLFRIFQDSSSGGGAGGAHINTTNRNLMITASVSAATDSGVYLKTQGQFGIGTNNPTSKLDVVGDAKISGVVTATDFDATSDIRLKTNVQPIEDPIAKVIQIEGVSFNWKKDNRPALGVIADQVEKVLPQLVHGDDPKTVNYNGLVGLLIEVVKDQQKQINTLSERISKLE